MILVKHSTEKYVCCLFLITIAPNSHHVGSIDSVVDCMVWSGGSVHTPWCRDATRRDIHAANCIYINTILVHDDA